MSLKTDFDSKPHNIVINLKILRQIHGMTQEDLAIKIGRKRSIVGAWEEGRSEPRISDVIKLLDLFKVSFENLISPSLSPFENHQISAL